MNALITAIKSQKDYILANDGRLLKKFIFVSLILILASQPGILGSTVQKAMADAYLQVSVFVGFTLFIFCFVTFVNFKSFLIRQKIKKYNSLLASVYALGSYPHSYKEKNFFERLIIKFKLLTTPQVLFYKLIDYIVNNLRIFYYNDIVFYGGS